MGSGLKPVQLKRGDAAAAFANALAATVVAAAPWRGAASSTGYSSESQLGGVAVADRFRCRKSVLFGLTKNPASLALSLVVALIMLPVLPPSVATANAGACQGSYAERHLGWYQGGQKWGATALLTSGPMNICTNPASWTVAGSFAWSNIQGGNGPSSIVQVGVGRCRKPASGECNGNRKVLFAWGREANGITCLARLPFPQEISAWDGSPGDAKVVREGDNWILYWQGTPRIAIPYSYTSCSWTPASATFFTETWNDGDSNGGDAGASYAIRHMAYQNSIGGGFTYVSTSFCNLTDPNTTKYHCTGSGDQVNTWTVQ